MVVVVSLPWLHLIPKESNTNSSSSNNTIGKTWAHLASAEEVLVMCTVEHLPVALLPSHISSLSPWAVQIVLSVLHQVLIFTQELDPTKWRVEARVQPWPSNLMHMVAPFPVS